MKAKKIQLKIDKEVISSLSGTEMNGLKGGGGITNATWETCNTNCCPSNYTACTVFPADCISNAVMTCGGNGGNGGNGGSFGTGETIARCPTEEEEDTNVGQEVPWTWTCTWEPDTNAVCTNP